MNKLAKFIAILSLTISSASYALSSEDNLGDWRAASQSDRSYLVKLMVDKINNPRISAPDLIACIDEVSGGGGLDYMKISEVTGACAVLLLN